MPEEPIELTDPNACPNCGTIVEPTGFSHGIGARGEGEPLPEPNQEVAICPECRSKLRRVEGRWVVEDLAS